MIRFELPLRCAPTLNRLMRMHWAERSRLKQEVMWRLLSQCDRQQNPAEKLVRIVATRHSKRRPDPDNPSSKLWLDCLKPEGLNLIRDDSSEFVDLIELWTYAASAARVVVEVRTEEP